MEDLVVRGAEPRDLDSVVGLIRELAAFEDLSQQVVVQRGDLERHLFGPKPAAECIVAQLGESLVAFALYFTSFSTFLGKPGLYLEDLYVQPAQRGRGVGKQLLIRLAELAVARDYGRFEWSVLDWNANAIAFYQKMGATVMPDWRICRVTGEALHALASR
ncbi:MAG: family acetyltransferase [Myxococcaceae bacterium]|nr:family acetyltransferase [Myxococcaceae bacterium]